MLTPRVSAAREKKDGGKRDPTRGFNPLAEGNRRERSEGKKNKKQEGDNSPSRAPTVSVTYRNIIPQTAGVRESSTVLRAVNLGQNSLRTTWVFPSPEVDVG